MNGVKGAKIAQLVEAAGATGAVTVQVPRASERRGLSASAEKEEETREEVEKVITVSGEREAVAKVVAAIEAEVVELVRRVFAGCWRRELMPLLLGFAEAHDQDDEDLDQQASAPLPRWTGS